jgi:RND family efflux transporter MFP subunit
LSFLFRGYEPLLSHFWKDGLFAPMDGVVGQKFVEYNENVQAGSPIVSLETEKEIEVKVGIPVTYINSVRVGDSVVVRFESQNGKEVQGVIGRVSYVTNETSTYPVFVKILEKDEEIRPGIPAEVIFNQTKSKSKMYALVPLVAVGEDSEGHFIILFEDINENKGVADKRYVEVIKVTDEGVLLEGEIGQGDYVITAGLSRIEDGMDLMYYPEFKQ